MDVKKYFSSINHEILNNLLYRKIKDKFILDLCKTIIAKGGDGITGLPIGNLTSQFFANVYLDNFDHFVKERLGIKSYLRYMDDFCIFYNDKKYLKDLRVVISDYLKRNLCLELKESATLINNRQNGLSFLGVNIYPNLIRYKKENFNRSYKKLKIREYEYKNGLINYDKYSSSQQSLISHLTYYGNGLFRKEIKNSI